jgi:nascent polypeptide-associated complex subunit alpha
MAATTEQIHEKREAKIEEVESDSEGEHNHDHEHGESDAIVGDNKKNLSRGEKKARKAMAKLGLKPIAGINRVTIRRSKTVRAS